MGKRPQQTINPQAFALQAGLATVPKKKKDEKVVTPPMSSQPLSKVPPLQSQAPVVNPKIGGISWSFGATNINAKQQFEGSTAKQIGTQQKIIDSQPKTPETLPETGSEQNFHSPQKIDIKEAISQLWTDISKWATLKEVKEAYPEFQNLDDSVLSELGADISKWATLDEIIEAYPELRGKYPEFDSVNDEILGSVLSTMYNGAWPEEIMQKFPELVGNSVEASAQGWVKGEIARQGSSNSTIELANPVGAVFEGIDNLARKIPTVNKEDVKAFIEKYNLPFDPEVFPTMFLNIPWSTIKTTTASARGLTNPLDNFIGLYKLVMTPEGRQVLGDRYGSIGAFEKSMTEDPTGVASDILSVIQLGTKGASAVNKGLGNAETAAKLSNISNTAGGAANMGMDIIPWALDNLANQWGAKGVVGKVLNAPLRPIKTAGDIVKGAVGLVPEGAKNYVAKKLISNKLKITDTNKRAIQKASWVESNEFMLENDLIGDNVDVVIDKTQDMIDSSMKQKLETFESIKEPQKVGTREKLMTQSVIDQAKNDMSELYQKPYDQIKSDEILPELQSQFNIIDNLEKLSKSATTEAIKLQALQSLYDMYNTHLKYDPTKKRILRAQETIRLGMQKQLEDLGAEMWVDIKDLNKKIAGGMALKKWLDQAWNRMDNNNMFWLSDTQTAILGAALGGWPIGVTAWLLGKSVLENMWVRSKMAKSLYTKQPVNGWSNGSSNTAISRATASSNISNQFGGSDTAVNSSKSNIKVKPVTNTNKVPVKASEEVLSKPKTKVPVKNPTTPKTISVWTKSKFSDKWSYKDVPVIRMVDDTTLYRWWDWGQFWTPDKKYAEQFWKVKEKKWSFYQVDNGNRVTDVYVEAVPDTKMKVQVKEANPLLQEAKKYKSAEEFMYANMRSKNKYMSPDETFKRLDQLDSQELKRAIWIADREKIPEEITLYRGIKDKLDFGINPWDFLTKNKKIAEDFGKWGKVKAFKVKTKDLLWDTFWNEEVLYAPSDYYKQIREEANGKPKVKVKK